MKMLPLARSVALLLISTCSLWAGENWPQFRGPDGDGKSDATGLPVTFSPTENVRWKTPIHGKAWSSPVIWGNQVWVTTATEDGKELSVLCLDKETGRVLHDKVIFHVENPQFCHPFNSYASPTPVIEDGRIYVTFGSPGTACLDTRTAEILWERRDLVCNHFRGAGSSPALFENLLLLNFDGSDFQFAIAFDKKTGKTVWKTDRSVDFKDLNADGKPTGEGDFRKAFATPQVVEHNGIPVFLSSGSKAHYGYDARTGKELWRLEHGEQSASSRPVTADGIAYMTTGYGKSQLVAIKLGGSGLLDDSQVAWRMQRGSPIKPSLLLVGDLIFMINDAGFAICLERKTGTEIWRERVQGAYSASPLYAEGHIYLFSESGKAAVIAAERQFKLIAENNFDTGFMAAPAVSGKALFLRTKTDLYRLEK